MKGSLPKVVYYLMALSGTAILIAGTIYDVTIAITAIGAGLLAYGVNRIVGEWRVKKDPEYAKKINIANKDERLSYIADKSKSMTLGLSVIILSITGIILLSLDMMEYGNCCFYIVCGISLLYFIVYQAVSRGY